jgi:hypothetical protein
MSARRRVARNPLLLNDSIDGTQLAEPKAAGPPCAPGPTPSER